MARARPPTRSSPSPPRVTARAPQPPVWAGANAGAEASPATPLPDEVCGRFGQPTPRPHDVSSRGRLPLVGEGAERCGSDENQSVEKKISRERVKEKDKPKDKGKGPGFEVERRRREEDEGKRGRKAEVGAKADRRRKAKVGVRAGRGHKPIPPSPSLHEPGVIRPVPVGGSRSRILAPAPSAARPASAGLLPAPRPTHRGLGVPRWASPVRTRFPFDPPTTGSPE
jgi:hypothetical protein